RCRGRGAAGRCLASGLTASGLKESPPSGGQDEVVPHRRWEARHLPAPGPCPGDPWARHTEKRMASTSSSLLGHGEPVAYFTFSSLTALGVPHATTTKHCPGVSSFAEPIVPEAPKPPFRDEAAAVLGATGLEMGRVSYARQVHGADVARAPAGGGFAGLVDILVTAVRAVPLAI